MSDLEIKQTEVDEVVQENASLIEHAKAFVVSDQATYATALEICQQGKARIKLVDEKWGPQKDKAHELHAGICKILSDVKKPLEEVVKILSTKAYNFQQIEKKRLQDEENERQRKEQKRIEEERLAAAAVAEASGNKEQAEAIISTPVYVAPVKVETEKVAGVYHKENWQAEVICVSDMLREDLMPDMMKLNKIAKEEKEKASRPGVRFFDAGTTVFKG